MKCAKTKSVLPELFIDLNVFICAHREPSRLNACGGAVLCATENATLKCNECVFTNNSVTTSDPLYDSGLDTAFLRGTAAYLSLNSISEFINSTFINQTNPAFGAGIYITANASLHCFQCDFLNSLALAGGAGICAIMSSSIALQNCSFVGNEGDSGAGLYATNQVVRLDTVKFISNKAYSSGGGIYFGFRNHYRETGLDFSARNLYMVYNSAVRSVGGCIGIGRSRKFEITDSFFALNAARYGGCIASDRMDVAIEPRKITVRTSTFLANNRYPGDDDYGRDVCDYEMYENTTGGAFYFIQPVDAILEDLNLTCNAAKMGGKSRHVQHEISNDFSPFCHFQNAFR
jgi:predicted outer membrane repeat protein